jgi:hypothetical protein
VRKGRKGGELCGGRRREGRQGRRNGEGRENRRGRVEKEKKGGEMWVRMRCLKCVRYICPHDGMIVRGEDRGGL